VTLVQANGIVLHVQVLAPEQAPATRTAVLLHGLASDTMASWYFTLAYPLVELGFRVVLLDLRGHGRSERPPHGYALADFVDDLEAVLDVHGGPGPYHLFGNSFGGTVAFAYAARHPGRVAGIVAVESSPPTRDWFTKLRRRLDHGVAVVGAPRGVRGAQRARQAGRLLAETTLRSELPASELPGPDRFAAVDCPVLCLYGGGSKLAELAAETERLLPRASTRVFAGEKHSLLIDRPDDVRTAVTTWLRTECPG
jgi:pimeloyl-ACP methyl ester carboxylesterase